MRGWSLATASLSRNYRLNTGFVLVPAPRRGREVFVVENETSDPSRAFACRHYVGDRTYAVDVIGPGAGSSAAAARCLPRREFQRQAAGCIVCFRLHRIGLS